MLIESTNELIKRTNDNCEKTMYFQMMLKNLMIRLMTLKKELKKV